jgi:drug/metabolite transporter (DMT)-like permease
MVEPREHQPLKGVLLIASALFFLATMDAATKFLSQSMPVPLLLGIRYAVSAVLVVAVFVPRAGLEAVRTRRTGMVVLRSLCLVVSSLVFAMGLKSIALAEATSIVFTGPLLLMFAGRAFLKETIGWLGWVAAALGFTGVLLVVRPGGGVDLTGAMLVAISSALSAVYHLMSRTLARTETTGAMLVYANVIGAIVFGSTVPGLWPDEGLNAQQIVLLLVSGVLAGVGHFMITAAYRYAPASLLAPANYVQLLWTVLLGLVVFGTVPDALAGLGMVAIAGAGLLTAFRARLQAS